MSSLADKRVLLVGAGGLGSPVALVLAASGVGAIEIADDDRVSATNLHRQLLYGAADVGRSKAIAACERVTRVASEAGNLTSAVAREMRFDPGVDPESLRKFAVVVDGVDNFPSKFLLADACAIAGVPCVQGGAVRWGGWALASVPGRGPCLRCVFEDIPQGPDRGCAEAGVVGPVVGVIGALQAALALRLLHGDLDAAGALYHYDGLAGSLRRTRVARSATCRLCAGEIRDLKADRYLPRECAAEGTYAASTSRRNTMAITVRVPTPLRTLTQGKDEVEAKGATIRELIEDLERNHPGLKERLCDDKGVRRFVNIYQNEEDIRFLEGLDTKLKDGDSISIVPAIAGGASGG